MIEREFDLYEDVIGEKVDINKLEIWDKKIVWHPFTQMAEYEKYKPLIIVKGEGNYLIDINGKKYLDGVCSIWCNVHGHNVKELNEALYDQANKIAHSTLLGAANLPSILLAKALLDIAPKNLKHVFYSDDGSTAMEVALKMAYQYHKMKGDNNRYLFVKLSGAYHGDTIGSVSLGGVDLFHSLYKDLLFETIKVPAPFPESVFGDKKEAYERSLEEIEKVFEKYADKIVAFVMEPLVQVAAGVITHPKGYLKKVRELCDKYNILLILDEVATGFGKTGKYFACQIEDVKPDIMAVSKGLTAGYMPLAATLCTEEIYQAFYGGDYASGKTFFHGHTYTGNPLGCRVALENLRLFRKKGYPYTLKEKILFIEKRLKEELSDLEFVGDIRGIGFIWGIELVKDKKRKIPFTWKEDIGRKVSRKIIEKGVFTRPLGPILVFMPPLSITLDEIDFMVKVYKEAISEVLKC